MKRIILALIAVASCNIALAADPAFYVSASVGAAKQKYSAEGESFSTDETGYQIAGGYRVTPNVGVEVGYTSFGKASESQDGLSVSLEPTAFYGAVTGSHNITGNFAVTGKLGVARNSTKAKVSFDGESASDKAKETTAVFGLGVAYTFNPDLALIAEYQNFGKVLKIDGAEMKAQMFSVGLRYNF